MATLLFSLRNVPDDEADEVRALLTARGFDFYETSPGKWGFSTHAIWLRNDDDLARARPLIDEYQRERARAQRAAYEQARRQGTARTLWDNVKEAPLRVLFYLVVIVLVLYFSIKPFLDLYGD